MRRTIQPYRDHYLCWGWDGGKQRALRFRVRSPYLDRRRLSWMHCFVRGWRWGRDYHGLLHSVMFLHHAMLQGRRRAYHEATFGTKESRLPD